MEEKLKKSLLYSQVPEPGGKAFHTRSSKKQGRVVKRQKGQKQVVVLATVFIGISTGKVRQNRENSLDWMV